MTDGFTRQFAIRLPNGKLLTYQPNCTHSSYLFGGGIPDRKAVVFDDRTDAEAEIERRRRYADIELGVEWNGWIEQRNCSPFSATDPSEGLADEVSRWAEQQDGAQ